MREFRVADFQTIMNCEVEDGGTMRPATILRSLLSPADVVIWYGGTEYEGLDGGYTFEGGKLRDSDGDTITYCSPAADPASDTTAAAAAAAAAALGGQEDHGWKAAVLLNLSHQIKKECGIKREVKCGTTRIAYVPSCTKAKPFEQEGR